MSNTITIGALRLARLREGFGVEVRVEDNLRGGFAIDDAEWQSLEAVAAVVEAAREWHQGRTTESVYALESAIDALDTSSRGSK